MLYIRRIIAASRGCLITTHGIQVSKGGGDGEREIWGKEVMYCIVMMGPFR